MGVLTAFVGVCLFVLLTGCQGLRERIDERDTPTRVAVQYAALKYIGGDAAKAERVRVVAEEVLGYVADESATVAYLAEQVRAVVPWNDLDPADNMLLTALLAELEAELRARLGEGTLDPEDRVRVERVVHWIILASKYTQG